MDFALESTAAPMPTEARLAALAAAMGPLRRVVAALAVRWLELRGHERLCYARLRDYARERLGISARQIQDLARVGRALAGLPRIEHALLVNELPWSKVRLLVLVAKPEDEESWVALAQALSTQRLERVVREHARSRRVPELEREATTRVTVRCTPAVHEKWLIAREFAERVAGQRLGGADALEAVAAEVFSAIGIDPGSVEVPEQRVARVSAEDVGCDPEPDPERCPRGAAWQLPHAISALARGLAEADEFEVDRRMRRAVRLERTLDAEIAPLLRIVSASEYEWSGDYQPLARYAPDSLGMSARKARALLRLERAQEVCPELRRAYRSGRLSWVKAHCLLPLLLLDIEGEYREVWVAWAERTTVRRLERDVERALLLRAGHDRAWFRCKFEPERAQDPIPAEERQLCAHDVDPDATQELVFRLPLDVAALFAGVRESVRSRLERVRSRPVYDGEVFDALLDSALLSWTLRDPHARRPDPVAEREGYRCAVPGCTSRCNHHDHHIHFRGRGGSDALTNRVLLCAFHHQRCLHAGLMRIRGHAPDGLLFELGVRSTGGPLVTYRSGDVLESPTPSGGTATLERAA